VYIVSQNIWDPLHECLQRKDLEHLQLEHLRSTLERVSKVPCYKEKFAQAGVGPDDIHALADLAKLPFTTMKDLRQNYPFDPLPYSRYYPPTL
jgi:phenylacetate-CoA ligase